MGRLFGTDGIRGVANTQLSCRLAMDIGAATALVLQGRSFMLGCDTRVSSDMLGLALAAGICSTGADVLHAGIIPTPAVAHLTRKYGCDAGVVISASHNPPEFNGIKIFSSNGMKLPDDLEERIESLISAGLPIPASSDTGRVTYIHTRAVTDYIRHLTAAAPCRLTGMRIAVDCANGAAAVTAGELFRSLGAKVSLLGCDTGSGSINVDCGSTHLDTLRRYVVGNRCHAGVAFDGDGDRCLFIDENGDTVDGDMILAICARNMKASGKLARDEIVATVMSNLGLIKFCLEHGINFEATRVGDRYVLEKMLQDGCVLGGEQSGHIIFLEHSTTGDGQLTAIQLLCAMKRSGRPLSELAGIMRRYPQHMVNIPVSDEGRLRFYTDPEAAAAVEEGRRRLGDEGRILVRTSGTEPLIRVMTEGADEALIRSAAEETADKLRAILS